MVRHHILIYYKVIFIFLIHSFLLFVSFFSFFFFFSRHILWTSFLFLLLVGLSFINGLLSVVQMLMAMTVLSLAKSCRMMAPSVFGRSFHAFIYLQVVILIGIAALAQTSNKDAFAQQKISFVEDLKITKDDVTNTNKGNTVKIGYPSPTHKMLPICDVRWGKYNSVGLLDVGVLTTAIYDTLDYGKEAVTNAFEGGYLQDVVLNQTIKQGKSKAKERHANGAL